MFFPRSLLASAVVLFLSTQSEAWPSEQGSSTEQNLAEILEVSEAQGILQRWSWSKIFGKRQDAVEFVDVKCPTDDLYIEILDAAPSTAVQVLCNNLLDIPPATVTLSTTAIITNFTSGTATLTSTVHISTTQTVTETATITPAALLRRNANFAAQFAVANSIMDDVIANGDVATALALATPNKKQEEALSGFGNACSCETVAPLSTTTVTDPLNQYKTVGKNVLRIKFRYQTNTILKTVTVPPSLNQTTNSVGSGVFLSLRTAAANVSTTESIPASITSPPSVSVIAVASGSVLPAFPPAASNGPSAPVVIGLPFECPKGGSEDSKANGLSPQFIVGDYRYEYSVLCDTAITNSNVLAGIPNVANQTACAVECSLVNSIAQRQLCESASFIPNPGASDGQCFLHGPASSFERRPGSVTVLLTGISSKSDKCKSVDLANGPSNTTVDTAQLLGDVITKGFLLSTPGLVTRSETGGVYKSFWSSGFTASDGGYYYTWYEVFASSSAWWEVYATSWSCTAKNTPQTAIVRQPVENITSAFVDVTYVVDNGTTTIFSGTSTFSRNEGAGVVFPTSVSAVDTGGVGAFTASFVAATSNATAGAGVEIPVPTSSPSSALVVSLSINGTSAVPQETASQGSASAFFSGNAATWNSTQGGGFIPASPTPSNISTSVSQGTVAFTVSQGISSSNTTAGAGGQQDVAQSSGGNGFTIAGGISTSFSNGGSGFIPPIPTNVSLQSSTADTTASSGATISVESEILAPASTSEFVLPPQPGYNSAKTSSAVANLPANSTGIAATSGTSQLVVSEATPTVNTTGGILSSLGTAVSVVASTGTLNITLNATLGTAGTAQFTLSGSNDVTRSTGSVGSVGPIPLTVNSTQLPPSLVTSTSISLSTGVPDSRGNDTLPVGSQGFTLSGATAVTSASQGFGVIPPSGTAATSLNANISTAQGTNVVSASGFVSELLSTGSAGFLPPASANITIPASTGFVSETASAFVPAPSSNGTEEEEEGGGSFGAFHFSEDVTNEESTDSSEAASTGAIPLLSANISLPASISAAPSPTLNSSLPSGTAAFVTSGATDFFSVASGNGIVQPSAAPISSGFQNVSLTGVTSLVLSTGNTGVVLPSVNLMSAPASITPIPSSNTSTADEEEFTNSLGLRTRRPRSSSRSSAPIGTAPLVTAPAGTIRSTPVANSTILSPPPFIPNNGYGVKSSSARVSTSQPSSTVPLFAANSSVLFPTASGSSAQPSVTIPPFSGNVTSEFPAASGSSTGPDFENEFGARSGRLRSRTSASASPTPPSSNITLSGTAPISTGNISLSGTAPLTASIPLGTGPIINSTQPYGASEASISAQLSNDTSPSSNAPILSANTSLQATGPTSVLIQSSNIASVPLVTAPIGTGLASISTVGNFSAPDGPRRGSISRTPANSTAFFPTGSAASSTIPLAINFSAPMETAPVSTSVASSGVILPSANLSAPLGTASVPVPLSTGIPASITASNSLNLTSISGTGLVTGSPSAVASVPLSTGIAANVTSFAIGTGASTSLAVVSLNSTLTLSTAAIPSLTPTPSSNSSGVDCPTPTPKLIPHTTVWYETVLESPSTCAPTASASFGFNATLPTGTGLPPISTAVPTTPPRTYRRSGEIASQQQIDQACLDKSNIVINPDFAFAADNTAFGWTTQAEDASIAFRTENSTTSGGSHARVLAAATNRSLTISQPLTLCPGKQYKMTSSNKVGNVMSKCQADYYMGSDYIDTATPQETYLRKQEFFTAGNTPEEVSQDLRIVVKCKGESGIPAGTDDDGYMHIEIVNVGVQQA